MRGAGDAVELMQVIGKDAGLEAAFRQIGTPSLLPPGTPHAQVKILREAMAKMFNDSEFRKDYKKLVGEEPTPLLGEDMERGIKDLPRDPELVDLFKKLNAAGPLPPR